MFDNCAIVCYTGKAALKRSKLKCAHLGASHLKSESTEKVGANENESSYRYRR